MDLRSAITAQKSYIMPLTLGTCISLGVVNFKGGPLTWGCVRMSVCQHVCLCVGVRESVFCVCVCRGTPLTQPAAQPVAVIGVSIILQSPKWRICTVQRVQC